MRTYYHRLIGVLVCFLIHEGLDKRTATKSYSVGTVDAYSDVTADIRRRKQRCSRFASMRHFHLDVIEDNAFVGVASACPSVRVPPGPASGASG